MTESTPESASLDPQMADTSGTTERRGITGRLFGTTFVGQAARATLAPIAIYIMIVVLAIWRALVDPQGSAEYFAYIRDLVSIALSLTLIVVFIGLGVLVIQVARFVNLLRSEVKPITRDTRAALQNVRTTSSFVKKQAAEPIIRTSSFMAGLLTFLREITRIARLLRQRDPQGDINGET